MHKLKPKIMKKIITIIALSLLLGSCSDDKDCEVLEQGIRDRYEKIFEQLPEDEDPRRREILITQMNKEISNLDC